MPQNTTAFSEVSKQYLCRYYAIFDEMIEQMLSAKTTDSISHNFIMRMIPHHNAAVLMSENLLQYTTCLPLQRIAHEIVQTQTEGIRQMQQILPACSEKTNAPCDLCLYTRAYQAVFDAMVRQMQSAPAGNNLDKSFILEMIPHHLGAVRMSENALRFPVCPALHPLLHTIITTQRQGILEMQRLLQTLCR